MNGSRSLIDARGLACPEPVLRTKKALEAGGFAEYEIIVDNEAAVENLSRFASYAGAAVLGVRVEGALRHVVLAAPQGAVPGILDDGLAGKAMALAAAACPDPALSQGGPGPVTVFIASNEVGRGESALGRLLMKGFLHTLAESGDFPRRLVFMNAGVLLCVEGSESVEDLRKVVAAGVEVLACGTCLDFYKVKEKLVVGKISNMFEISKCLLEGRTITL